jgi:hypothetical protein
LPDLVDLVSLLILAGVPEGPGVLGVRMRLVPGASITRSSVTDSDAISLLTAVGSVGRRAIAQPQDARPEIADEHGPLPQSGGHNLVARLLLSRRRSTDGVDPTEVQRTCSLGGDTCVGGRE